MMPAPISAAQREAYATKGFVAVPGLIDGKLLAALREEYDRELRAADSGFHNIAAPSSDGRGARSRADGRSPVSQDPSEEGEVMLQRMNMCEVSMEFRKLLHHEGMLDVAQELMGGASGLQLFHDQALYKPGLDPSSDSFGGNMQWHQDNGYWKCEPANLMSCWIALDDVTEDNGALRMVPGSFTTGLAEGTPMPQAHREDGDAYRKEHIDPVFDVTTAETLAPLAAGSAVFHHCRCLHSSLPNRTARQRRAFVIHLMVPGTAGADGTVFESSWARPILRLPRPVTTAARSTARMQAVAAHLGGGDSAGQQPEPTPGQHGRRVPPPSSLSLPPSAAANRIEGSAIPPPQYVHVPRLPAGSQASLDYLSENGYCVVAAALTPTEVTTALELAWEFAEAVGDGRLQVGLLLTRHTGTQCTVLASQPSSRTHWPYQMHSIERLYQGTGYPLLAV